RRGAELRPEHHAVGSALRDVRQPVASGRRGGRARGARPLVSGARQPVAAAAFSVRAIAAAAGGAVTLSVIIPTFQEAGGIAATAGGCFRLRFDDRHPVLRLSSAFSGFGCRLFHYGDAGYFVRRSVFREMGGFDRMPFLEDLDFWLRLTRRRRVAIAKTSVLT